MTPEELAKELAEVRAKFVGGVGLSKATDRELSLLLSCPIEGDLISMKSAIHWRDLSKNGPFDVERVK